MRTTAIMSVFALLALVLLPLMAQESFAQSDDSFFITQQSWQEHQALLAKSAKNEIQIKQQCHIEYRNCWVDYEYRCTPISGGTINCVQVPVRRCGRPEMICD